MNKRILYLAFLAITILLILSSSAVHAQAKWTFMVYLDADNDLEPFGILDFNEMEKVGSSAEVNIIVQMDRISGYDNSNGNWTGTKRYKITKDSNTDLISSTVIQDMGEVNMGDPASLTSFIDWATTNYPAANYALVLWDHGGGWQKKKSTYDLRHIAPVTWNEKTGNSFKSLPFNPGFSGDPIEVTGIPSRKVFPNSLRNLQHNLLSPSNVLKNVCVDQTSGDELKNAEISSAINASGTYINLIGFDACLMAMIENAYPLRNLGDVMVGSEETEPGDGWPYDLILTELKNTPTMTPATLAETIVLQYGQFYNALNEPTTLSAINLKTISNVAVKLDAFTQAITTNNTLWDELDQLRVEVDKFYIPEHKDLWHIADRMLQLSSDANVDAAAANLKTAITDCVIKYYSYSPNFANSKGIAIYFPDATAYNPHYGEASNNIDFMQMNQWDEFLITYFNGGSGGTGTNDPDINYGTDSYEPNNNFGLAYGPLNNNIAYHGYLIDAADIDIYRLEIPEISNISINLDVPADFDLYLLQPIGSDFSLLASSEESGSTSESMAGNIDPGVYYLAVTAYDTHQDPYSLTISGITETTDPVLYQTTLAYDFGDPSDYIWGTTLGDAAACMYTLPSVPARLNKIWLNLQDLDAGGLGGDGTFYLYTADYYGSLLADTIRQLTPQDTGWLYLDLEPENIYIYGDFLVAILYDGFNTPGIGYDNTKSFGNNLFFSEDYPDGYMEDPGTYFIRAEIEYLVSNATATGIEKVLIDPSSVSAYPNPFIENTAVQYLLNQSGDVDIAITDINGHRISSQTLKNQPAGQGSYRLEGAGLAPGMYILQVKTNGQIIQKKLIRR